MPKSVKYLFAAGILVMLSACSETNRFNRLERHFHKHWPTSENNTWPEDITPAACKNLDSFLLETLNALNAIDKKRIAADKQADYQKLLRTLQEKQSWLQQLSTNPATYNLPGYWKALLSNQTLSDEDKLQLLNKQLPLAPVYYLHAREKLSEPETKSLELALRKHITGVAFLDGELKAFLLQDSSSGNSPYPALELLDNAKIAVKEYIAWCNSQLLEQVGH